MDIITGIWNVEKRYASWSTDDGDFQGFAFDKKGNGKGKLYFDSNGNKRLDKKDKKIGNIAVTDAANDDTQFGTWMADLDARLVSFLDNEGIEVAIGRISNTSFF